MSTPRELLAARIRTDNPEFEVKAYPATYPSNLAVGAVQVAVFTITVTPNEGRIRTELSVEVIMKTPYSDAAETVLQDSLDKVLLSVERVPGLIWNNAERATFDESFSGYRLSLTCINPNVYKSIIREEQKGS